MDSEVVAASPETVKLRALPLTAEAIEHQLYNSWAEPYARPSTKEMAPGKRQPSIDNRTLSPSQDADTHLDFDNPITVMIWPESLLSLGEYGPGAGCGLSTQGSQNCAGRNRRRLEDGGTDKLHLNVSGVAPFYIPGILTRLVQCWVRLSRRGPTEFSTSGSLIDFASGSLLLPSPIDFASGNHTTIDAIVYPGTRHSSTACPGAQAFTPVRVLDSSIDASCVCCSNKRWPMFSQLIKMPKVETLVASHRSSLRTTESAKRRRYADHPADTHLDFDIQITVMIWLEENTDPVQVVLYPREDLRVRLCDHKIVLAEVGLEQQHVQRPERHYRDDDVGKWWPCAWDTPLKVSGPGDMILLAVPGLTDLKDFFTHELHMRAIDTFPPAGQYPVPILSSLTDVSKIHRRKEHASDFLLDFGTPVTAMIWKQNCARPVQVVLYPREDLRVRFCDHIKALAAVGFEQQHDRQVERFHREGGLGTWWSCTWATPLKVSGTGDTLLLSYEDVDRLKEFGPVHLRVGHKPLRDTKSITSARHEILTRMPPKSRREIKYCTRTSPLVLSECGPMVLLFPPLAISPLSICAQPVIYLHLCPPSICRTYFMDPHNIIYTAETRISPAADTAEQSAAVDSYLWYKNYPFLSTEYQLAAQPKVYLDETSFLIFRNFPVIAVEDLGDYFARDALVRHGPFGRGRIVWWAPPRIILLSDGKLRAMPRLHTASQIDTCQVLPSSPEEMVEVMAEVRAELQQLSASLD
ncbi:hypothetical protein FB451DRAFT_1180346 [Mycena latifolia]|nr:hypothetical protein FB451DRAFT_1180346 [Mycena latifolia]